MANEVDEKIIKLAMQMAHKAIKNIINAQLYQVDKKYGIRDESSSSSSSSSSSLSPSSSSSSPSSSSFSSSSSPSPSSSLSFLPEPKSINLSNKNQSIKLEEKTEENIIKTVTSKFAEKKIPKTSKISKTDEFIDENIINVEKIEKQDQVKKNQKNQKIDKNDKIEKIEKSGKNEKIRKSDKSGVVTGKTEIESNNRTLESIEEKLDSKKVEERNEKIIIEEKSFKTENQMKNVADVIKKFNFGNSNLVNEITKRMIMIQQNDNNNIVLSVSKEKKDMEIKMMDHKEEKNEISLIIERNEILNDRKEIDIIKEVEVKLKEVVISTPLENEINNVSKSEVTEINNEIIRASNDIPSTQMAQIPTPLNGVFAKKSGFKMPIELENFARTLGYDAAVDLFRINCGLKGEKKI